MDLLRRDHSTIDVSSVSFDDVRLSASSPGDKPTPSSSKAPSATSATATSTHAIAPRNTAAPPARAFARCKSAPIDKPGSPSPSSSSAQIPKLPRGILASLVAAHLGKVVRAAGKGGGSGGGAPVDAGEPAAAFYSQPDPSLPIARYVAHLAEALPGVPTAAFAYAVLLVRRAGEGERALAVGAQTVHRLYVCALMVADKWLSDVSLGSGEFAEVGGLEDAREMNEMEMVFLKACGWRIGVEDGEYTKLIRSMLRL